MGEVVPLPRRMPERGRRAWPNRLMARLLWAALGLSLVCGVALAEVQPDARGIQWQQCALGGAAGGASRVTTGGTAVTLTPTQTLRGIYIQNPFSATESLFVDVSGLAASTTAGVSIELPAGASFSQGPGTISTGAYSINAVTSSHSFACKYGQ